VVDRKVGDKLSKLTIIKGHMTSKQRILPHFVCYHVTKILFFNIFTYLWARGQGERIYTLLHSPTPMGKPQKMYRFMKFNVSLFIVFVFYDTL
jgi:hypothetical protein